MCAYRIKRFLPSAALILMTIPAMAQTAAPLAVAPSAQGDQTPVVISAPETQGLALPPPVVTPPPAPVVDTVVPAPMLALTPDAKPAPTAAATNTDSGLGASIWKGTSRVLVERFLPMLSLPLPYATLNNLAARLLTAGAVPEGAPGGGSQSLTAMRADKLVALGKPAEAWTLVNQPGGEPVDGISLRQTAEAALVSAAEPDVCAKLPGIVQKYTDSEWQKMIVFCQLAAKDTKAAQVALDLLHTQDVHDDTFFALAEKNVMAGNKQLPRQLTPLTGLNLALIRLTDLPVRTEVYIHPDAVLIPELLKAKAVEENARLALAERAAAKGIIDANALADAYRGPFFGPEAFSSTNISGEHGPMLRAMLYQASQQEKNPQNRINEAVKFLQSLDAATLGGGLISIPGSMIGDIQPAEAYYANAVAVAEIYILSSKPNIAMAWIGLARDGARGMPQIATDLQNLWPVMALGGLEAEKDFGAHLDAWLDMTLHPANPQDPDARAQKATASAILLLLDATGFSVSDTAWAKIADAGIHERIMMPPALVMDRLRNASTTGRKGETILMGLLASVGGKEDPPMLATIEVIRALRLAGFTTEAGNLAMEEALRVLNPMVRS